MESDPNILSTADIEAGTFSATVKSADSLSNFSVPTARRRRDFSRRLQTMALSTAKCAFYAHL
jgi:hypothetical protein